MKMSNEDLKKITAVKQYLLDPPISFKLKDYAINYLNEAIDILKSYPLAKDILTSFKEKQELIKDNTTQTDLLRMLKEAGIQLSNLTNK